MRFLTGAILALSSILFISQSNAAVKVIFDTDLGTPGGDVDDLGALAVLHGLANQGEVEILAVMLDHNNNSSAIAAVDAVNTYFKRGSIPIGRRDGNLNDYEYNYADKIAEQYSYDINVNNAPTATWLYRNILSKQGNNSVKIVTTGKLFNIDSLLNSGADANSSLNGKDLVDRKVSAIHTMGGHYPSSYDKGSAESNFANSGNCGVRNPVNNSPSPMIFNGFEVGAIEKGYSTGPGLNSLPNNSPVKTGYTYWFQNPPSWAEFLRGDSIGNWSIWDQIAIFTAVKGSGSWFNEVNYGFNDVGCDGNNYWNTDSDRNHTYLTQEMDPNSFADNVIEPLMKSLPLDNSTPPPSDNGANNLAGIKRLSDGWQNYYLSVGSDAAGVEAVGADLNTDWWSQMWVFEKVENNIYRLKNRWSNKYLSTSSQNEWTVLTVADLNADWWSQMWVAEKVSNGVFRLKNRWSGLYLSSNEAQWAGLSQAELREDWSSQRWSISGL